MLCRFGASSSDHGDSVQRRSVIFYDIAGYAISRLIPAFLGVVTVIALSRLFGVVEYGRFALVASAANTASVIGVGWLTQSILRFASGDRGWYQVHLRLISKGFLASAIVGMLVVTTGLGLTLQEGIGPFALLLAALLSCLLSSHAAVLALLQAAMQVRGFALLETVRALAVLAFSLAIVVFYSASYVSAIGGSVAALLCTTALGAVLLRSAPQVQPTLTAGTGATESTGVAAFLRYGIPLSAWLGLSIAMPFVERVLIQRYTDAESLGVYAALYDMVFRGSGMVVMPIVMALHPKIMALGRRGDEAGAKYLIIRGIGLQVLAATLVLAFLWVAGKWIVDLTIRPQLGGEVAYKLVIPLALSGCVWHIALLSHKLLECRSRTGAMTVAMACAIGVTIGCNVLALPIVGVLATPYASAVGGVFYCMLVAMLSGTRGKPASENTGKVNV